MIFDVEHVVQSDEHRLISGGAGELPLENIDDGVNDVRSKSNRDGVVTSVMIVPARYVSASADNGERGSEDLTAVLVRIDAAPGGVRLGWHRASVATPGRTCSC